MEWPLHMTHYESTDRSERIHAFVYIAMSADHAVMNSSAVVVIARAVSPSVSLQDAVHHATHASVP